MGTQKLTDKEQQVLTLYIVDQCIKYGKENGKTFEAVLNEDVFANVAQTDFAEMICTNIDTMYKAGYISGRVELAHEIEMDLQGNTEELESIDFSMCTFEDISITAKGKALMAVDNVKAFGKEFFEKSKPVVKCIATTALQTAVELSMTAVAQSIGFVN